MTNNQYSTHLISYNESDALQQLLKAANNAIDEQLKELAADIHICNEFTITINGVQTAFYLGGPQFDALIAFIQHIAAENFYAVDVDKQTVEE